MKNKFNKITPSKATKDLWKTYNEKSKEEKEKRNENIFIMNDYKAQLINNHPNENLKLAYMLSKHNVKDHLQNTLLLSDNEFYDFIGKFERKLASGDLSNDEINISKIETSIVASLKKLGVDLKTGVTFGSSNSNNLEMSQYHVMTTDGSVIMTNGNFQIFIYRAAKLISKCLSYQFINDNQTNTLTNSAKAIENYVNSAELIRDWAIFFEDYSKYENHPHKGNVVRFTERSQIFASAQIVDAMLAFALGHEIAHHAANHCEINYDRNSANISISNFEHEFLADIIGLDATLNINIDGGINYFCRLGIGSVYLLKILKYINIFRNYANSGEFVEIESSSHPKYDDRINMLERFVALKYAESDMIISQFNDAKDLLEYIFSNQKDLMIKKLAQTSINVK